MASKVFWTEWVGFAGLMMVLIGILNVIQGLIAIIRDDYYVLSAEQIIVFDLTTWGWILLIWGVILALAGWALATGAGWARWFTIVVASLNIIVQLGFVGSGQYSLWALTVLALNVLVLYALTVRWSDVQEVRSYEMTTTD
ncbi:MAG: DUF7144 family membrane protein [Gaiellaceae bacterium]